MKRSLLLISSILMLCACTSQAQNLESKRPAPDQRLFKSTAVENKITQMGSVLKNRRLAWMFANCYPNTLDTTVHFGKDENGDWRTFVYTGDIHAMWLRDSGAQVWPYIQLANEDEELKNMLAGVINCQFTLMNLDPYANAFNDGPKGSEWASDKTDMSMYGDGMGEPSRVS